MVEPAEPWLISSLDLVLSEPIGVDVGALLLAGGVTGRKRALRNDDEFVVVCLEIESRSSVGLVVVFYGNERSEMSVGRLCAVVDARSIVETI